MATIPEKINLDKYRLGKTFRRLPYTWRMYRSRTIGLERESYGFHYWAGEFKYNGWREPFGPSSPSHRAKQISNKRRRRWEERAFVKMLKELEQDKERNIK